ncbi:MAG: AmmeMemoRadiSam system protein B [Acidilobaceae archaeon]
MKIRLPYHAGSFYPSRRESLIESIKSSFTHRLGPGSLPSGVGAERLSYAYIVPHAGYMYSGPIAAHAYLQMSREKPPETVILVGPNHTGLGLPVSVYKEGYWRTPLGDVEVNSEVSRLIVEYTGFTAYDEKAHIYEHSIEVQIPFLQYVYSNNFKITPITVMAQTESISKGIAEAILRIIKENGVDAILVATTDLNHYEPHDITVEKDMIIIKEALEPDPEGIFEVIDKYNITACGPGPMATAIYIAKITGTKPILLAHATSGDITGEKDWVVGYTSIKIQKAKTI